MDDDLAVLIFETLALVSQEIAARQKEAVSYWSRRKEELKARERNIRSRMHPDVRRHTMRKAIHELGLKVKAGKVEGKDAWPTHLYRWAHKAMATRS